MSSSRPPSSSSFRVARGSQDSLPVADGLLNARRVRELQNDLRGTIRGTDDLGGAAQSFANIVYNELSQSIALVRVYATIPLRQVPATVDSYVRRWSRTKGVEAQLSSTTPIWTLLGSRGANPDWNDRKTSKNHVGLPLLSQSFIETFPMIGRLFSQLGIAVVWNSGGSKDIVLERLVDSNATGFFYVDDARTSVDHFDRPVIPAQDFVNTYGIRTVFGTGGQYENGALAATIVFTRGQWPEAHARKLAPLFGSFRAITAPIVLANRILPG